MPNIIRIKRKQQGLTQIQLAKAVGCTQQLLGKTTKLEAADGLKLQITIHRVQIKRNLYIRFSLRANQAATLTTERTK